MNTLPHVLPSWMAIAYVVQTSLAMLLKQHGAKSTLDFIITKLLVEY